MKTFYVGDKNEKLNESLRKSKVQREIVTDFYQKLRTAYITAVVCIQEKLALNNPLLSLLSAIDSHVKNPQP